jgi:hypothetical protein
VGSAASLFLKPSTQTDDSSVSECSAPFGRVVIAMSSLPTVRAAADSRQYHRGALMVGIWHSALPHQTYTWSGATHVARHRRPRGGFQRGLTGTGIDGPYCMCLKHNDLDDVRYGCPSSGGGRCGWLQPQSASPTEHSAIGKTTLLGCWFTSLTLCLLRSVGWVFLYVGVLVTVPVSGQQSIRIADRLSSLPLSLALPPHCQCVSGML